MSFTTSNGTKLFISSGSSDATNTAAEYEALSWVAVRGVTNLGEFGDSSADVTSTELGDNRVQHQKGAKDGGSPAFVCNSYSEDPGQILMFDAFDDPFDYAFKVEYDDKLTSGGDNSCRYFKGKVMSTRESVGSTNNPVTVTFNVGINSDIVRTARS